MEIQFCGAARTVTGSMHLLSVNGRQVLLDCGLFPGHRQESYEKNRHFPFNPRDIHSLVLSHAHIDHAGNIPRLVKEGFRGPIFCTQATRDLCGHMLPDSAFIQEKDLERVNRKRAKEGKVLFEPLYTLEDVKEALELFEGIPYRHPFEAAPGLRVELLDAGHILGSATVHLRASEGPREARIVFTGDVGRPGTPIIRDPEPFADAEVLISESTYGDRLHPEEVDHATELRDSLRRTVARRGKVLIPAVSVGRTQTVVYHLHRLILDGQLEPVPIFVDSPLSANVTDVFRRHPECYDEETGEFLEKSLDPFGFARLTYVRTPEESKALNDRPGPFLVIAASGMCESGRVLHHLKHVAPSTQNTVLLVGFMAEHTLGRRIQDGAKEVKVYGEVYPLRAEVKYIPGFSGHADRKELLGFFSHLKAPPRRTFLVHGELDQAEGLARHLGASGFPRVDVPAPGERFGVG